MANAAAPRPKTVDYPALLLLAQLLLDTRALRELTDLIGIECSDKTLQRCTDQAGTAGGVRRRSNWHLLDTLTADYRNQTAKNAR